MAVTPFSKIKESLPPDKEALIKVSASRLFVLFFKGSIIAAISDSDLPHF